MPLTDASMSLDVLLKAGLSSPIQLRLVTSFNCCCSNLIINIIIITTVSCSYQNNMHTAFANLQFLLKFHHICLECLVLTWKRSPVAIKKLIITYCHLFLSTSSPSSRQLYLFHPLYKSFSTHTAHCSMCLM